MHGHCRTLRPSAGTLAIGSSWKICPDTPTRPTSSCIPLKRPLRIRWKSFWWFRGSSKHIAGFSFLRQVKELSSFISERSACIFKKTFETPWLPSSPATEVYAVDWSLDGSRVATGSKDRLLKIWRHWATGSRLGAALFLPALWGNPKKNEKPLVGDGLRQERTMLFFLFPKPGWCFGVPFAEPRPLSNVAVPAYAVEGQRTFYFWLVPSSSLFVFQRTTPVDALFNLIFLERLKTTEHFGPLKVARVSPRPSSISAVLPPTAGDVVENWRAQGWWCRSSKRPRRVNRRRPPCWPSLGSQLN